MTNSSLLLNSIRRISILGVVILLLLFILPFETQKLALDRITPDGNLESFTWSVYRMIRILELVCIAILISLSLVITFYKSRSEIILRGLLGWAADFRHSWYGELRHLINWITSSLVSEKQIYIIVILLTFAVILRYAYLWRPMGHDETYTYMAFAARGLRTTLTDYHLPNNHVLHTVLVVITTQLFGNLPAVIRLPAFIAGVLIVPAVYLFAVNIFDRWVATASSAAIAALPVMIDYSTTARGYTLIAFFTLLLAALFLYIQENRNRIAWLLIVLLSSLGLFTVPVMLYPIGMLMTWFLISGLQEQVRNTYRGKLILYVGISSCLILLFTGILYFPIIINSGITSVIGNNLVESLNWTDFWQSLPVRARNTWAEWNRDLLEGISYLAIISLAFTFICPPERRFQRFSFWVSAVLFILPTLIIQRVAPWPRIWLFLLPLTVIWVMGGVLNFMKMVGSFFRKENNLAVLFTWVIVLLSLAGSSVRSYMRFSQKPDMVGEVEEVAIFLKGYLKPGDVVVVTSPDAVVLKYYLLLHGVSGEFTEMKADTPFERAIVVVNTAYGQTMEFVLEKRSFRDEVNIHNGEVIYQSRKFILYQLPGP